MVAALVSAWPGWAGADSACFVEHELLGKQADAWLWGSARAGSGPVRLYSAEGGLIAGSADATDSADATKGCEVLAFQRWPCDTDYAFLPIERSRQVAGLARARLRSGGEVWLRPAELGVVAELMKVGADGRSGRLLPAGALIRRAPSGKAAAVVVEDVSASLGFIRAHRPAGQSKAQLQAVLAAAMEPSAGVRGDFVRVLKAEAAVTNAEGHWVRIKEQLAYTVDDGLTQDLGPTLRTGYLLHRNRQGVVKAVIEPLWCD